MAEDLEKRKGADTGPGRERRREGRVIRTIEQGRKKTARLHSGRAVFENYPEPNLKRRRAEISLVTERAQRSMGKRGKSVGLRMGGEKGKTKW